MINVRDMGAIGDGQANDGPAIQSAINGAVAAGGDTILFPRGRYRFTAPLSLADARNVHLIGEAGSAAAPQRGDGIPRDDSELRYEGSTGPAIDLASAQGITFSRLRVRYTTQLNSVLIRAGHSSANRDARDLVFESCAFEGAQFNSATIFDGNRSINLTFRDCAFRGAFRAITGAVPSGSSAGQCNVVLIERCSFEGMQQRPIFNPGQSWTVLGCTFEHLSRQISQTTVQLDAGAVEMGEGAYCFGLTYEGNWHGDVGNVNVDSPATDYGAWLRIRPQGAHIAGNYFGWSAQNEYWGLGRAIEILGGTTGGVEISGNRIQTPTAIRVQAGAHTGYVIQGNFVTTNPQQSLHEGLGGISRLVVQGNHGFSYP
jgi:hypothetical protein